MTNRAHLSAAALALILLFGRCSLLTAPEVVEDFTFTELQLGQSVTESADARAFSGEIIFAGQLNTPYPCFDLRSSLDKDESRLTLRVEATARNQQCVGVIGAYRYTGAVRQVKSASYDFAVVHVVPGQPDRTFNFPVVVR